MDRNPTEDPFSDAQPLNVSETLDEEVEMLALCCKTRFA